MTLVPVPELLHRARSGRYAIGYFESWNLESLQGTLDAAEETGSPVILGFNGEFLTSPARLVTERIHLYAALGRSAAMSAHVPCGLIFNECPLESAVRQAVLSGFNLVMWTNPSSENMDHESAPETTAGTFPEEPFVQRLARLAAFAHQHQAAVEAELGELPSGENGAYSPPQDRDRYLTDPEQARWFVEKTRVDVLSVSVGNVHVLVKGQQDLNLTHLEEIVRKVPIPLGLHGGTGISPDSLKEAVRLGITKVNYGTGLKLRYLNALRTGLAGTDGVNPHRLLGYGAAEDLLVTSRLAVKEAILERLDALGCIGKGKS
jgi:ketose-bisphosphate aldolase